MSQVYTIKLILDPYCEDEDATKAEIEKALTEKEKIYKIIESSLYGFDILQWYIKGDKFGATIRLNGEFDIETTVKQHITDTYGEMAGDTWMEGDISINKREGSDDIYILLGLGLTSIKTGDHLEKKRKCEPDETEQASKKVK